MFETTSPRNMSHTTTSTTRLPSRNTPQPLSTIHPAPARRLRGSLSHRVFTLPDVNRPPMPALAASGVILNGESVENFGGIDAAVGYPDVRSFRRKFGLILPATNTSMEHE
jgi:hypothetical protein